MKFTKKITAALLVTGSLVTASSVYAFSDIQSEQQVKIADALQSQGVIQGISNDKFGPAEKLTAAQGIQMLVKAMKLQPTGDHSASANSEAPASAWYASAANIAADHGLPTANIDDWNARITREQFATMLYKAVLATGDYPTIKMYINVQDENEIVPSDREAIQFLLLTKIVKLDDQGQFHPKQNITRMEAAEMTYNAMNFVSSHMPQEPGESDNQVSVNVEKVNDQVNKIVISKEDMPNPGYGIVVERIEFVSNNKAVAYYHTTVPEPGKMYPQVISTAKASFYLDSSIKITVKQSGGLALQPLEGASPKESTLK